MGSRLLQFKQNHLDGKIQGIISICTAHPLVLKTAMNAAKAADQALLIEATANQVNPYGGYTGLTPQGFVNLVKDLAGEQGFREDHLIFGADHAGPQVWKKENADSAMEKAQKLVQQCVLAGFTKIHLDTAAICADDPPEGLSVSEIAGRAARLCRVAEHASRKAGRFDAPLYVIGDEVPVPGGGLIKSQTVSITDPDEMMAAVGQYQQAFSQQGLDPVFDRVLAMVVQPGVDFGDDAVCVYDPKRAEALSKAHDRLPGRMTYEIHATDYQPPEALQQMVKDHFALLKVGPCLTFALRKAFFGLAEIEARLPGIHTPSHLPAVMERLMLAHPVHWQSHYKGTKPAIRHLLHSSRRDRMRYYWAFPDARNAVDRLLNNLQGPLPDDLLHLHLADLCPDMQVQGLAGDPQAIVQLAVGKALAPYLEACDQHGSGLIKH